MPGDEHGSGHDVVVIGASAGGIEALKELVGALPRELPAALFVVLHLPVGGVSTLPAILARAGELPAFQVTTEGAEISPGTIYVAPPDFHIQLEDGRVDAIAGPRENGHRPAVDPLFRSAAHAFGRRVVGVILSGALDDGTLGLRAVKAHGGVTLVQDPETALHPGMPESAIAFSAPDRVGRPSELAALIVELANDSIDDENGKGGSEEMSNTVARESSEHPQPGVESGLTCPECGGAVWRDETEGVLSFRCRVGHKYGAESFASEQGRSVEAALWAALRLVEERIVLVRNLEQRYAEHRRTASSFQAKGEQLEQHAVTLRELLGRFADALATPSMSETADA